MDMELSHLMHILEPRQLGCGTPDGAGLVVLLMRAWAAKDLVDPDPSDPNTFETLDLGNAHGRAHCSAMVKGAVRSAPGLALLYAAQWQGLAITTWQGCEGAWRATSSARGGWQGSRAMMVRFCIGLEETFADIPVLTELGEGGRRVCVRVGYQDDTYLVAPASFLARTWDELGRGLEKRGHRLRATKCSAWAPSCAHFDPDDYPDGLKDLSKHIVITTNGIKLLGGSVGGDLEFEITADAVGFALARKRFTARCSSRLAPSSYSLPHLRPRQLSSPGSCSRSAAHTLCRSIPAWCLPWHSRRWKSLCGQLSRGQSAAPSDSILTVVPGTNAQRRLQLAGCFGGCGLRRETAGVYSDAANYAAWASNAPRARLLAQALGRPPRGVHGVEHADEVRVRFAAAGVLVSRDGDVKMSPDHAARYVASAWQADQPLDQLGALQTGPTATPLPAPADARAALLPRRFVSRIWRHLGATEAAALWHAASRLDRVVMLWAGGAGAGNMWVQLPMRVCDFFDNSHFRASTFLWLADMRLPTDSACQLVARHDGVASVPGVERWSGARYGEGRVCGQPLGRTAEHALLCKAGPARQRPHKQLATTLAAALRAAGAHVDLERVVPEMMNASAVDGANRDAILDKSCSLFSSLF